MAAATRCRRPFLVLATQNPIESEGTYQLPEAQLDRFLFKLRVDYPTLGDEAAVVEQSLEVAPAVREVMPITELERFREVAARVFVDRRVIGYTIRLADATRHPGRYGLDELGPLVEYGASPRGPIGLAQSARALALLRGRDYATTRDVRDVARRRAASPHRAVLRGAWPTASAPTTCSRGSSPPSIRRTTRPGVRRGHHDSRGCRSPIVGPLPGEGGAPVLIRPAARQGPGALPEGAVRAVDLAVRRRIEGQLAR